MYKKLFGIAIVALLLGVIIGGAFAPRVEKLAGLVHMTKEIFVAGLDAEGGLWVGSTQVIDSSGNIDAAVTSSTGTFSSTLSVTGAVDFDSTLNVDGLFTRGGGVLSTSTVSTAMVPTAATFNYSLIEVTPLVADLTYTFPASSTLSAMIPDAGDTRVVTVYNATTTAGIDVIFAAGTGMEIKTVGTATAVSMDEASFATLTFVRKANSDILVLMATPLDD